MPKVFRVELTSLKVGDLKKELFIVTTPNPADGTFATVSPDEFLSFLSK